METATLTSLDAASAGSRPRSGVPGLPGGDRHAAVPAALGRALLQHAHHARHRQRGEDMTSQRGSAVIVTSPGDNGVRIVSLIDSRMSVRSTSTVQQMSSKQCHFTGNTVNSY